MAIIDADAHVIETEQTWNFMLEEDRRFTPEVLISKKNGIHFWRVDDRDHRQFKSRLERAGRRP